MMDSSIKLTNSFSKQRRILGEVQMDEMDLSRWNINQPTLTANNKRLSDALSDQRSLKEQYNATAQQLFKRDQKIDELEKNLITRNGAMEKLEMERGKLFGELKQSALEKEQLNSLLQEELDVRKMIQVESQKLIGDIKGSYEHKISKLKDEIKTKEEVISIKEEFIKDLEKIVKQLRMDIISLNGELSKSRVQGRENQGKLSESFRQSFSKLQSQLCTKSSELESHIPSLQKKHTEEIVSKTKEFESAQAEMRRMLKEKEKELKEVLGRLEESRKSREDTLLDMHEMQIRYDATVSELKEQLENALQQNGLLRKNHKQSLELNDKMEDLEVDLQQLEKENEDLKAQLEDIQKQKVENEMNVKRLEDSVKRLEENILELESQKQELYEKTQEYLRRNEEKVDSSAAIKLLQEQLEQSQLKLDEVKESLIAERHRSQKFTNQLAEIEKSFGLSKVDVRILTREKTTLEQKLTKKVEEIQKLQKELEDMQVTRLELDKKVTDLTKTVAESQTKSEHESFHLEQARRMLEEMKEEKARLEVAVQDVNNELQTVKAELRSFDKVKSDLQDRDSLLKKREDELKEKARQINSLQTNVAVLKKASTVLDDQLREFESAFAEKLQELETSEAARTQLSSECSCLRENLQKSKIDLNEANSLKAFLERRLSEMESTMNRKDEQSSSTVTSISKKVEELLCKNAELVSNNNKFAAEIENITAEKEYLKTRFDEVNQDNYKLTQEMHKCVDTVFELKHETIKLNDQIKDNEIRAEIRIADLRKLQTTAIQAKDASNIQMQCTISQQSKLIQFLQDQNEALSKKKKFNFFSRGDKDKDEGYQTPAKKGITLPRMMQTPSSAAATPTQRNIRPFGVNARQESALVLGKCNDQKLLEELDALNKNPVIKPSADATPECDETAMPSSGLHIKKNLILVDEKQRIDVNCAFHISGDLYLLGCDQGLFSRKGETSQVHVVKIEGMRAVFQMEFISSLNSVLFIEGNDRRLVLASMGIVRTCAEAAECSQPRMNGTVVADVQNCHMFQVRDVDRVDLTVCVTTEKHIHILCWKDSIFVLRQRIATPEVVTCMLMTPCSVIYGAGKVYELDSKNFQLQEFLDETDASLYFVIFGSDDLTIPMAILDVGMSNWTPDSKPCKEFLICFPTMGIFVDEEGHRTRGEDIAWQKFPQSINYRHPNLFIFHHSSLEIIRLNATSYTISRIGLDMKTENVGKDVAEIPPSTYLALPTPNFIGKGPRGGSIVVTSKDKHKTEIYEIDLEVGTKETINAIKKTKVNSKPNPSSSDSPPSSSSSENDTESIDS